MLQEVVQKLRGDIKGSMHKQRLASSYNVAMGVISLKKIIMSNSSTDLL